MVPGNAGRLGIGVLAIVGALALTIHRAPLVHAIVGHPTGRVSGRMNVALVVAAYAYAVVVPLARDDVATILIATTLVASTIWMYYWSTGRSGRLAAPPSQLRLFWRCRPGPGASGDLAEAGPDLEGALSWIYPAAVALVGIILATDLSRSRWADAEVTRLVVDLGDPPRAGIRGRLAGPSPIHRSNSRTGSPRVAATSMRAAGRSTSLARDRASQVTVLEQQGERVGALVHDPAAFDDPRLLRAVAAAARIALANVRLQADVRRHLEELEASRRRLLETSTPRVAGWNPTPTEVGRQLSDPRGPRACTVVRWAGGQERAVGALLIEAQRELEEARNDLGRLATGVRPPILAEPGVGPALSALAERSGVAVRLAVQPERRSEAVETAIYFICSEALANVQKHAQAASVAVEVRVEGGTIVVVIADDGVGGAVPRPIGPRGASRPDRAPAAGSPSTVRAGTGPASSLRSRSTRRTCRERQPRSRLRSEVPGRPNSLFDPMPGFTTKIPARTFLSTRSTNSRVPGRPAS